MRRGDLPQVTAIERESFPTPWSEETFRGLLGRRSATLLAAEAEDGAIVGYAALWTVGEEAELGDLAVREGARRRGVGRALLAAALEEAARREAEAVFLEVRRSNGAARRLYETAGFSAVAVRPGYYARPREDALVMRRPLRAEEPVGASREPPPGEGPAR